MFHSVVVESPYESKGSGFDPRLDYNLFFCNIYFDEHNFLSFVSHIHISADSISTV